MIGLKRRLYISFGLALLMVIVIGALSTYLIYLFGVDVKALAGDSIPGLAKLVAKSERNVMLVLILVGMGSIVLLLVAPHRTETPIKKLFMAFREAEEGNLSVRLPLEGSEERVEFARAFNRLMGQLESLDEKRLKKIAFDQRRFEVLANVLDAAVFVSNIEGQILFANSQVYRSFDLSSKQLIGVPLEQVPMPKPLIRLLNEAITRKERVEDMPWELTFMKDKEDVRCPMIVDIHPVARHTGEAVNMLIILEERDRPRAERIFRREGR